MKCIHQKDGSCQNCLDVAETYLCQYKEGFMWCREPAYKTFSFCVYHIDVINQRLIERPQPLQVSDPSQKTKIAIAVVFGIYFLIWSILMYLK